MIQTGDLNRRLARQALDKHNIYLVYNEYCPFCIKTTMVAGYLGIERKNIFCGDTSVTIPLVGKHQVPILVCNGKAMAESDDICNHLDALTDHKVFSPTATCSLDTVKDIRAILDDIKSLAQHVLPLYRLDHPLHTLDFSTEEAKARYRERFITDSTKKIDQEQIQELSYRLEDIFCTNNIRLLEQISTTDLQIFPWLRMYMILHKTDMLYGPATVKYYEDISTLCDLKKY